MDPYQWSREFSEKLKQSRDRPSSKQPQAGARRGAPGKIAMSFPRAGSCRLCVYRAASRPRVEDGLELAGRSPSKRPRPRGPSQCKGLRLQIVHMPPGPQRHRPGAQRLTWNLAETPRGKRVSQRNLRFIQKLPRPLIRVQRIRSNEILAHTTTPSYCGLGMGVF